MDSDAKKTRRLTVAALVPRSEEVEVSVVWVDGGGFDGSGAAGTLCKRGDRGALERAVSVQLHSVVTQVSIGVHTDGDEARTA